MELISKVTSVATTVTMTEFCRNVRKLNRSSGSV